MKTYCHFLKYSLCQNIDQVSPLIFQRIAAANLYPGLMYFGCSIHGHLDLNEDGLVDLAVGSLGHAVLLWLVLLNLCLAMVVFKVTIVCQTYLHHSYKCK